MTMFKTRRRGMLVRLLAVLAVLGAGLITGATSASAAQPVACAYSNILYPAQVTAPYMRGNGNNDSCGNIPNTWGRFTGYWNADGGANTGVNGDNYKWNGYRADVTIPASLTDCGASNTVDAVSFVNTWAEDRIFVSGSSEQWRVKFGITVVSSSSIYPFVLVNSENGTKTIIKVPPLSASAGDVIRMRMAFADVKAAEGWDGTSYRSLVILNKNMTTGGRSQVTLNLASLGFTSGSSHDIGGDEWLDSNNRISTGLDYNEYPKNTTGSGNFIPTAGAILNPPYIPAHSVAITNAMQDYDDVTLHPTTEPLDSFGNPNDDLSIGTGRYVYDTTPAVQDNASPQNTLADFGGFSANSSYTYTQPSTFSCPSIDGSGNPLTYPGHQADYTSGAGWVLQP